MWRFIAVERIWVVLLLCSVGGGNVVHKKMFYVK